MNRVCRYFLICLLCAVPVGASAQTLTTLVSFDKSNGSIPLAPVVQGFDGNFYGTTEGGGSTTAVCNGSTGCGTIFKITPSGTLTTLYAFCVKKGCPDGASPTTGLIRGADGNFYGTTSAGGATNNHGCPCGTIFRITPDGVLTTLFRFLGVNGSFPSALVQGSDGNFYGTTAQGGANSDGVIFRFSPSGTFIRLYDFCQQANCSDGSTPTASLIQASDGNFYGVAEGGGNSNVACTFGNGKCGTVFRVTTSGKLTTLYRFSGTDGYDPFGALVQGSNGILYGTARFGGRNLCPQALGCGTVFQITTAGQFATLHKFDGSTEGQWPMAGLVQGTDGNFYGTNSDGGANSCTGGGNNCAGTVFQITTAGKLTLPYTFCTLLGCTDGFVPDAALIQATDGSFYGTTQRGGNFDDGIVFKLDTGLGPFVEAMPSAGVVGAPVTILGNNLTSTTAVSFNGTSSTFSVVSDTEITTSVPAGASTGKIVVTTASGSLSSNVAFRVTPQILSFAPPSGPVGTSVIITGESFTGTTAVSFGAALASSFTVNSDTQITATVPAGATTSAIAVRTPGGRAQSSTVFTVTP